jgi:hypothetical protein
MPRIKCQIFSNYISSIYNTFFLPLILQLIIFKKKREDLSFEIFISLMGLVLEIVNVINQLICNMDVHSTQYM